MLIAWMATPWRVITMRVTSHPAVATSRHLDPLNHVAVAALENSGMVAHA
jgi:hypothetical protein